MKKSRHPKKLFLLKEVIVKLEPIKLSKLIGGGAGNNGNDTLVPQQPTTPTA
jgi:hypothetical protein